MRYVIWSLRTSSSGGGGGDGWSTWVCRWSK